DVHRHDVRPGVDGGVVDDSIDGAEAVDAARDGARFFAAGEVADDNCRAEVDEVVDRCEPVGVADVDDELVAGVEQRLRGEATETIGGAGDEDARHFRVSAEPLWPGARPYSPRLPARAGASGRRL